MPRFVPTVLTMADMRKICWSPCPESYAAAGPFCELRPHFTTRLEGKNFCFKFQDDSTLWYRFGRGFLEWSNDGQFFHEEYAECLESRRRDIFLIHHLRTHENPCSAVTLVIDIAKSLVTLVACKFGTIHANRDVSRKVIFGAYNGAAPGHTLTDELTGVVIDWKFADNVIIHQMYENVTCCAFVSPPPAAAPEWKEFFITFNPTKYVKLREKLYLISFCAPGSSGMEASMLMDLRSMTQIGAMFGIDTADTLRSYSFGGHGAYAGVAFIGRYTVE